MIQLKVQIGWVIKIVLNILCKEAPKAVIELEKYGVPFSRTDDGKIYQRPFGGMTKNYGNGIVQRTCAAADRTGHAILHTTLWSGT